MIRRYVLILSLVVVPLVAFLGRYVVDFFAPSADQNLNAYFYLISAAHSEDFQMAKSCANYSGSSSDDPKIQEVANSLAAIYGIYLDDGIRTKSESQNLMGDCKLLVAGASNPASGLYQSAQLAYYGWNLEDKITALDSIYVPKRQAYINGYNTVHDVGFFVFLFILFGGWWFLYDSIKSAKR